MKIKTNHKNKNWFKILIKTLKKLLLYYCCLALRKTSVENEWTCKQVRVSCFERRLVSRTSVIYSHERNIITVHYFMLEFPTMRSWKRLCSFSLCVQSLIRVKRVAFTVHCRGLGFTVLPLKLPPEERRAWWPL